MCRYPDPAFLAVGTSLGVHTVRRLVGISRLSLRFPPAIVAAAGLVGASISGTCVAVQGDVQPFFFVLGRRVNGFWNWRLPLPFSTWALLCLVGLGKSPSLSLLGFGSFCPHLPVAWPVLFFASQTVICRRPCSAIAPWISAASPGGCLVFHALPCAWIGSSLLLAACLITTSVALG